MGHSGDIEILEKQVALLRDLLENLDQRRQERRRAAPLRPSGQSSPASDVDAGPQAPLRLVDRDDDEEGAVGKGGGLQEARRPRFREKRSWNLSGPSRAEPAGTEEASEPGRPAPPTRARPERRESDADAVPWRAFEHLLRERDDLIVQLMRQQTAEQRLLEARATTEGKNEEIQRLRRTLQQREEGRFDGLVRRLYHRLAEVEELQKLLMRRALEAVERAPAPSAPRASGGPGSGADGMQPTNETTGKKFWIRGHEVMVTTSGAGGGYYSFALLTVDVEGRQGMKGFKAQGATERESELSCIDRVLTYLEEARAKAARPRLRSSRNLAQIRGRDVDIFCDMVGAENYQAFPFLYDADGRRQIILRFHLDEAVTADTAEEARMRCVRRLEAHFDELDADEKG